MHFHATHFPETTDVFDLHVIVIYKFVKCEKLKLQSDKMHSMLQAICRNDAFKMIFANYFRMHEIERQFQF